MYVADGQRSTYSDRGTTGTAPPDPLILAGARRRRPAAGPDVDERPGRRALEGAERGRLGRADARDVHRLPQRHRSASASSSRVATRPIFGAEPRELSLLFVLFYIAASGDEQHPGTFERNFNTRGGAQMWRFHGGSQQIALRIAGQLGDRVRPRARRCGGSCRARAASRVALRPRDVPGPASDRRDPADAGRADRLRPDRCPFERDQLTQRYGQGTLTKVAAVYDTPFWRDAGLNGQRAAPTAR